MPSKIRFDAYFELDRGPCAFIFQQLIVLLKLLHYIKGIVSSKMSYNFYWPDQICIFLENFL